MDVLTRFGDIYTFPADQQLNLSDNFGDLVTRTRRLPGADGGFDDLGDGRGLSEIGSVRADLWLFFDDIADATAKMEAIQAMADWGVQRLFMQPMDISKAERWCWARVDNINIPQSSKDQPHKRIRVQLTFQVSDPFWYSAGSFAVWGDGVSKWGDGVTRWSGGSVTSVNGLSTTLTVTNNGNAYTLAQISLRPTGGNFLTDPTIRRVVRGRVVDEVKYIGALDEDDMLAINARKLTVRLNNVEAYTEQFQARNAYWMRLLPGSNTLEVRLAQAADDGNICVRWLERYI
jgi:hypothetical protein